MTKWLDHMLHMAQTREDVQKALGYCLIPHCFCFFVLWGLWAEPPASMPIRDLLAVGSIAFSVWFGIWCVLTFEAIKARYTRERARKQIGE